MYAILGITGHVGKVVADILLNKELPVRAVMRNPAKSQEWLDKGAEVAIAELHEYETLSAAFHGTEAVFIMTPPLFDSYDPMEDHNQMLDALSMAIQKANPAKIVYLSSVGAHLSESTGAIKKLYDMEQAFRHLDVPSMGIRAAWFMENFTGSISPAKETGVLYSFLNPTDEPIPMVAAADIGKLAAELLQENLGCHKIIELEGPCRYSADDVAMMLSYRLKKNISAQPIPDQSYEDTYRSLGFTPKASYLMAEMNKGFNQKHIVFEGNGTAHAEGETLLEDVINSYINV